MYLGAFLTESTCPNRGKTLRLSGKIFIIHWIYTALMLIFTVIWLVFSSSFSSFIRLFYAALFFS